MKTLLDFHAPWCAPCQKLAPIVEQLQSEIDFPIEKIDIDEHPELAEKYSVLTIPTLILLEDGAELKRSSGFLPLDVLKTTFEL